MHRIILILFLLIPSSLLADVEDTVDGIIEDINDDVWEEITEATRTRNELLATNLDCLPSIWPTKGFVSSDFGYRFHPITKEWKKHNGIDIANRVGTPIVATGAGRVVWVGTKYPEGLYIKIQHTPLLPNVITIYCHLSESKVEVGDYVYRGDVIGLMGNTGRSTGPHLHYGVWININGGEYVDPREYVF